MIKLPACVAPANGVSPFFCTGIYRMHIVTVTALLFLLSCFTSLPSYSQCNAFQNADAANPLLNALQPGETITSLDFVDIDGDGDYDCYTVPPQGSPQLLSNAGTPHHAVYKRSAASGFENVTTPDGAPVIQFVDIDGDGDYDCFITEISFDFRPVTGIRFYRNTGDKNHPQFAEDQNNNPVDFARSGNNYVLFAFADIDNDGDEDLYYTGFYNTSLNDYDQYTYLNTGSATMPSFTLYTNDHPHDFQRQRTYFDWNKDGLTDYISYDPFQNSYSFYKNIGALHQPNYIKDNAGAPQFNHGLPYRLADLNGDGAAESFTASGEYSTTVPVATIRKEDQHIGRVKISRLISETQSDSFQYRWEFNDQPLSGFGKSSVYAPLPGRYVLYVSNQCGTGVSLPYVLNGKQWTTENGLQTGTEANASLSVKAQGAVAAKAYPNPFIQSFTIQLPITKAGDESHILITDMAGKIYLQQTTTASQMQVGQGLQRGVYILEVWQNKEMVYRTKLIKE